ncbi:5,6-dimethylbenzimidazole synthase [Ochrobactrum sp. POC9]|uniref:5,6-dimethylbenzimidazole synthase n=1 Tax=unclassified Ochrobactrum TaxID=239106 RepID=UPI000D708B25|nr:5,6-dimethylbenzimidazole synthase [Ochrobactrum sp. POC9]MCH4540370.1 5,6-dimethylbenzimidazole synthase [Ochrobactrum sp. A-1]PWU72079.1 5,6-dimethylbenzimidazole synthase [Ochrobactrum sp. POC9]
MQFSPSERDAFFELLKWRRDVRHFSNATLDDGIIAALQEAMTYAPSVGNARPWRVISVESIPIRAAVRDIFIEANRSAAQIYEGARAKHYRDLKLEGIEVAPLQLAIFTETAPIEGHGLGRQSMAVTLEHSTAMAVQNLNLAARSFGLGVGMVSILDPSAMETLFQVQSSWRFSLYLCIGWPQAVDDTPLLHRNGWQKNKATIWHRF